MKDSKILIIGAGMAGLSAAERLSQVFGEQVVLIEKEEIPGGLAATLSRNGLVFDLGSHRLHTKADPFIIRHIEKLLGERLLQRKRRGKLYFQGKFIHYPPNIYNLLKVYSTPDIILSATRYLKNLLFVKGSDEANYESAMIRAVGVDIYIKLYQGYAKKLWGIDPKRISVDGMHRRKTVLDLKSLRNAFRVHNFFLYPRLGIGQIADALESRIRSNGGLVLKGSIVSRIRQEAGRFKVSFSKTDGQVVSLGSEILISTMPIDELYGNFFPEEADHLGLKWRDLRILYIHIDEELIDEAETYYFPTQDIIMGRVSEIKKYSPLLNSELKGTLLAVEIPVSKGDLIWKMSDEELLGLCLQELRSINILRSHPQVHNRFSIFVEKAYPIYEIGWREKFTDMYEKLMQIKSLYTIGRGGLFLHSNIDHSMLQGIRLAEHLLNDKCEKSAWDSQVKKFLTYSARD